ncbi:MAG: trehalose-phosphatase [Alphaproteobacteria bacterium]
MKGSGGKSAATHGRVPDSGTEARISRVLRGEVDFGGTALLLDVDGTLLDIAPAPNEIQVPYQLRDALVELGRRMDGALALISGRSLADLDRIFAPLKLPSIGGHGAETRLQDHGETLQRHADPLEETLREELFRIAKDRPGVLIEDKDYSIAIHYRLAPEMKRNLREEVARACANSEAEDLHVLQGKCVIEVKSAHFDKGTAVRDLMTLPPFKGRVPIFVGDDVTDDDVFRILPEFGGIGLPVGRAFDGVELAFSGPQAVRAWLARMLKRREARTT